MMILSDPTFEQLWRVVCQECIMRGVRVYWNIRRKRWSVQSGRTGRVLAHCKELWLRQAAFSISEAGRQRVIRTGRKNVHAKVSGTLAARSGPPYSFDNAQRVRYNPYETPTFITAEGNKVERARHVYFSPDGKCYAKGIHEPDYQSCSVRA